MSIAHPNNTTETIFSDTPLKKLKKQSILKKTPSRSSRTSSKTPLKNVKFNSKVNVSQFFSSPFEKYHEILVNSSGNMEHVDENRLFADEYLFKAAENAINKKADALEQEIQLLDLEIGRVSNENQELSRLIEGERLEFRRKGYNPISESEIEQLVLQNKSLQELVNEKAKENESLKEKLKTTSQEPPGLLDERITELERMNLALEMRMREMKGVYEREISQFRIIGKEVFSEEFRKCLELELEDKEREIIEEKKKLENMERAQKWEKTEENFSLEIYVMICAEFERLNGILEQKRLENNTIEQRSGFQRDLFY